MEQQEALHGGQHSASDLENDDSKLNNESAHHTNVHIPSPHADEDDFKNGVDVSSPEDYEQSSSYLARAWFSFLDPLMKAGYKTSGPTLFDKIKAYLRRTPIDRDQWPSGLSHSDIPKLPDFIKSENVYPEFEKEYRRSYLKERKQYKAQEGQNSLALLLLKIIEKVYRWKGLYTYVWFRIFAVIFSYLSPLILYVLLESLRMDYSNIHNQNNVNSTALTTSFSKMSAIGMPHLFGIWEGSPNVTGPIVETFNATTNDTSNSLISFLPLTNIYFQIGMLVLLFFCNSMSFTLQQHYFFGFCKVWLEIRNSLQTAIFQKVTRITPNERQRFQSGELTNLFSTDAGRLSSAIIEFNELWIIPMIAVVGMILIFVFFKWSALFGILAMLIFSPSLGLLAKMITSIETQLSKYRDERVKTMTEILQGIRIVKFFVFEDKMAEKVDQSRSKEYSGLKKSAFAQSLQRFVSVFIAVLGSSITFIAFYYLGGDLTISSMFTGIVLFETIRSPLFNYPSIISQMINAFVSARRLADFLFAEELEYLPHDHENKSRLFQPTIDESHYRDSTGYSKQVDEEETTSRNSIEMSRQEGKIEDDVAIQFNNATLAWSDNAEPVLRNVNIKFEKGKLYCIIGTTGAGKSSLFSSIYGDTIATEGSISVNKFSRIALSDENPWMINGTVRDNIIFDKSLPFDEERYQKVLHVCQLHEDLKEFQNYDLSEIGYSGINLSLGQKHRIGLARACYSNADIVLLDSSLNSVDARLCKRIFKDCIQEFLDGRTRILITHSLQVLEMADEVVIMEKGRVIGQGPLNEVTEHYDFSKLISEEQEESITLDQSAEKTSSQSDKSLLKKQSSSDKGKLVSVEDKSSGNISSATLKAYLHEYGWIFVVICAISSVANIASKVSGQLWISLMNVDYFEQPISFYVWIYFLLGGIDGIVVFIRAYVYAYASLKTSNQLHSKMLAGILRAPILFFDQNPVGRILNRFTQDLASIDTELLFTTGGMIHTFLNIIFTIILISIVTPLFLVAVIPIGYLFFTIQSYYRVTSREIRRLESIARSPVLSHFSSCLTGTNTIRALLVHQQLFEENEKKIDFTSKHSHYRYLINRWLGVRIQIVAQIVIFLTGLSSIITKHSTNYVDPSFLALSITYSLQLTDHFTFLVRFLVDMESSMTSVERIVHYSSEIEQEAPTEYPTDPIPSEWPSKGHIKFSNVHVRYREDLDPVLKSINIDIAPGKKIGLIGRSGCGKSTLLITLFRFLELFEGSIEIDGLDISKVGLNTLRKSLLIIPQQPVLFSGSIRYNLDIFNEFTDHDIWSALERVHMKDKIKNMEHQLNEPCTENGSNFSIGERQLLSLARCILRKAKIIIFDESTAFVDHHSDELVQKIIREEFKEATIITVAHRLDTIIDSDDIVVMRNGQIIEHGSPKELLQLEHSHFSSLVNETGKNYSSFLRQQANKTQ